MSREEIREEVLKLMKQKEAIESEIKELTAILTKNGVGMDDPLVDSEDFPKNSIDIYQVRNARHRIICLQNDHKHLMKQIENGLQGYYCACPPSTAAQGTPMEIDHKEIPTHTIPFAKVTIVSENSPAEIAGIHVNDEIVEFGSINSKNFRNITDIATLVQHSENSKLILKIKRNDRFINLQLLPKKWQGKGLLGCNIVSLTY